MLLDSMMLSRMSLLSVVSDWAVATDDSGTGVGTNENLLFRLEVGATLGPDVVTASSVWVSFAIFLRKLFLLLNLWNKRSLDVQTNKT